MYILYICFCMFSILLFYCFLKKLFVFTNNIHLLTASVMKTDMHCERYDNTLCAEDNPDKPSNCSGADNETCPNDDPEKEKYCFVVWTEHDGKVGTHFGSCEDE